MDFDVLLKSKLLKHISILFQHLCALQHLKTSGSHLLCMLFANGECLCGGLILSVGKILPL